MTHTTVTQLEMFIDGHPTPPRADYLQCFNPADDNVVAEVAAGTPDDVDHAVSSCRRAADQWAQGLPAQRLRVLMRLALAIREHVEEFATIETIDNGKPLTQARSDVEGSARYFEYYAGLADKHGGQTIPLGPDYFAYTRQIPFGVVGLIVPWNAPLQQLARGLAPALAAGNAVVAKPAEDTPRSALLLARIAIDCGLPPGVFNVVTGLGEVVGEALTSHSGVDKIVFTGSVETGRRVNLTAAARLAPTTLELGGKSANIVFADADLDRAAAGALKAINANAGQNCSAGSRLLVHRSISDALVDKLTEANSRVVVGPGMEDHDMGPITTREQFDKVRDYIEVGQKEGATYLAGGVSSDERPDGGYYVHPGIFVDVRPGMRIAREEIFGPVLTVQHFDSDDEAIAVANDSDYGLVAGVWTSDVTRVHRLSTRLQVGQVYVNDYFAGHPGGVETPFGGTKNSGFGREKGAEAMSHYSNSRTTIVRL